MALNHGNYDPLLVFWDPMFWGIYITKKIGHGFSSFSLAGGFNLPQNNIEQFVNADHPSSDRNISNRKNREAFPTDLRFLRFHGSSGAMKKEKNTPFSTPIS